MESPEFKEGLIKENKSIFERVVGILEKRSILDESINARYETLQNIMNPDLMVDIGVAYDETARDTATEDFTFIPQEFHLPACFFEDWQQEEAQMIVSTPYGPQSRFVIGADGRPYMFQNIYFFSTDGQAKKIEQVIRPGSDIQSPEEAFDRMGWDRNQTVKVNFTPREEDSRYIDLEKEDYEKVKRILEQIESGEYIQVLT